MMKKTVNSYEDNILMPIILSYTLMTVFSIAVEKQYSSGTFFRAGIVTPSPSEVAIF